MALSQIDLLLQDIHLASDVNFAIVKELRKLVLATGKNIQEEVKYGGILFSAAKPFCGIFAYANHVSLEFGNGAILADLHKVLEGQGKFRRHIKLQQTSDIESKHIKHYLALAYAGAITK